MTEGNGLSWNERIHRPAHTYCQMQVEVVGPRMGARSCVLADQDLNKTLLQSPQSTVLSSACEDEESASPWRVAELDWAPAITARVNFSASHLSFPWKDATCPQCEVWDVLPTPTPSPTPTSFWIKTAVMVQIVEPAFIYLFFSLNKSVSCCRWYLFLEKCERRDTCENRQLSQHPYTLESKAANAN